MALLTKIVTALKRGGNKAHAKDYIKAYLQELWMLKMVGWGVDRLDEAQQKCLLTREELQGVSEWCKKHPRG